MITKIRLAIGAAVGAIILGLCIALWFEKQESDELREEKAALEVRLDEAVRIGNQNAERAKRIVEEMERNAELVREEIQRERARSKQLDKILMEIRRAPASHDGPVAPVLRDTFRRLRETAAPRADERGAGEVPPAGGTPLVR